MSGTDFRNEYKNAMDELTPSSELLKRISQRMEQPNTEPIQLPAQNKSFFSRHKAMLTATATLVLVVGICAVGSVVLSHFSEMESLSGNSSSAFDKAGAASSIADSVYEANYGDYAEAEGEKDGISVENSAVSPGPDTFSPSAPGVLPELGGNTEAPPGDLPEVAGNTELSTDDEYYTDSQLRLLAEKAQNGTLAPENLGKNITVVSSDAYCQVFGNFQRGVVGYTLVGDFKSIKGEFKVMNLYIIETDENGNNRSIDLINHLNFLDRYFAGDYSDN